MSSPLEPSPQPRYEFLDALRGIAILGVILCHSQVAPLLGASGVQLFFEISAFTIFLTLSRAQQRERHSTTNFFLRRFFRILPMFWVGILLYSFLPSARESTIPPIHVTAGIYALTAVLLHGWHPFSINSVVPGGWTIGVEGTFYLMAPFLLLVIKKWQDAVWLLLITIMVSQGADLLLQSAWKEHLVFAGISENVMGLFRIRWFPSQFPSFAFGLLSFELTRSLPPRFWTKKNGLISVSLSAAILLSVSHLHLSQPPIAYSLGYFFLLTGLRAYPNVVMVNPVTCFLGRISYSVYLLHFAVLLFLRQICHVHSYLLLFLFTACLTAPLAWITYQLVEQPFIRLASQIIRRRTKNSASVHPPVSGAVPLSSNEAVP